MSFINPLELLEIDSKDYNPSLIRKQKRKLFADLELSDEKALIYYGRKITKSDVEKVIEELDEFHFDMYKEIYNSKELNAFLTSGNEMLLNNFLDVNIKNVVSFITPYYTEQYDNLLDKYLAELDITKLEKLSILELPINLEFTNSIYPKTYNFLKSRLIQLEHINNMIDNKTTTTNNDLVIKLFENIDQEFNPKLINPLPFFLKMKSQRYLKKFETYQ